MLCCGREASSATVREARGEAFSEESQVIEFEICGGMKYT